MKTFKFLSNTALAFSLALLASCSSNDDFEETGYRKQKLEFKANIVLDDSTAATRVALEDDYTVTWDENDQILVYCDNADEAVTFGTTPDAKDGRTAYFTNYGEELPLWFDPEGYYYALYPNGSQTTYNPKYNTITSLLPTNQKVSSGRTYDKKALMMAACADKDEREFNFRNIPALIKVTLTNNNDGKVKFIEIIADNNSNKLTGNFDIYPYYNGMNFYSTSTVEKKHTVKLQVPANEESVDYYLAVLPVTITSGFTIKFEDKEGFVVFDRHSSKRSELKRSKIYNFGSFDVAAEK